MNGKPFFDTNILIYAFGGYDARSDAARMLLAEGGVVGVQTLNEFVAVARRKLAMSWPEVLDALAAIGVLCPSPIPLVMGTNERCGSRSGTGIVSSIRLSSQRRWRAPAVYFIQKTCTTAR